VKLYCLDGGGTQVNSVNFLVNDMFITAFGSNIEGEGD
jgi:hypothetical protein